MIPLYKPYTPDLPELSAILKSGKLSYGDWTIRFEKQLGQFIGQDNLLSTNSYNSAMLIAIQTLGLGPGDQIIASPMSCLASNQPFATQNIDIIWADINPLTGALDPQDVQKKISSKTKAIVHNYYCGYPGYISDISSVAKEHGLYLIEDAIEAFGSKFDGKLVGNTGADITVFSFQTVRLPNTIEGGGLAIHANSLFEKARMIRDYGIDRTKFRDENGEISVKCDINLPGYGALMNDVNGYIGYQNMLEIENLLEIQAVNANRWKELTNDTDGVKVLDVVEDATPNYWVQGLRCNDKMNSIHFFRNKGYYASGVHLNNNEYSVFGKRQELKGVKDFYEHFVAVPCGWWTHLDFGLS